MPVGFAGVEERPDPVVREAAESEGGALDAPDEVVDRFGGPVGDAGAVPVHDGDLPAGQGAAQAAQLGRAVGVGEVGGEVGEVRVGDGGAGDVVEAAEGCLGVARQANLAAGIAGGEQAPQLGVAGFVESFVGGDQ